MFIINKNTFYPSYLKIVSEYNFVPAMTSDTTPAPFIASASSVYNIPPYFSAFRAFDKISNPYMDISNISFGDSWPSAEGTFNSTTGTGNEWIQIKLDQPRILTRFVLRERGTNNSVYDSNTRHMPKVFNIKGSNDGNNWNIIQNYIDEYTPENDSSGSGYKPHSYDVNNINSYLYYRLNITALNQSIGLNPTLVVLGEWELYSKYA
jgi:hypothetical protein